MDWEGWILMLALDLALSDNDPRSVMSRYVEMVFSSVSFKMAAGAPINAIHGPLPSW